MLIKRAPQLAHHLQSLIQTVSHFSYQLQPDASFVLGPSGINPHNQRMDRAFRHSLTKALQAKFVPAQAPEAAQHTDMTSWQPDSAVTSSSDSGNASQPAQGCDTWVLPTVQYGALGLRQDEACTVQLLVNKRLQHCSGCCLLCLCLAASSQLYVFGLAHD